ncbi:hypothetical protein GCM10010171_56260 [Actinokineospora fastidiosa]|uniref:Uncharacterized protein n=1 Tax=Actinokineospora fastidiosa TaxID=1816 RepID=A0A918LIW1_9PSEU|nr:hypothetical protein GCM10010171_56260 [Actinokineospora fastidiosa]
MSYPWLEVADRRLRKLDRHSSMTSNQLRVKVARRFQSASPRKAEREDRVIIRCITQSLSVPVVDHLWHLFRDG